MADLLLALLDKFTTVFIEPIGMPPPRSRDHCINLIPGSLPVAVRPYRYPASHKDELERQCTTMLEQGLIQRSCGGTAPGILKTRHGPHHQRWPSPQDQGVHGAAWRAPQDIV